MTRGVSSAGRDCHVSKVAAMADGCNAAPVFEEWGRITKFLESALAFARERNLWTSLEIATNDDVRLSAPAGHGVYKVRLSQHLAAVRDDEILLRRFSCISMRSRSSRRAIVSAWPRVPWAALKIGARGCSPRPESGGTTSAAIRPALLRSPSCETRLRTAPARSMGPPWRGLLLSACLDTRRVIQ